MSLKIKEALDLLNEFERRLIKKQKQWKSFTSNSIDSQLIQSPTDSWEREKAFSWMYFDPNPCRLRSLEKINTSVLASPLAKIYSASAEKYFLEWQELERDIFYRKGIIPQPNKSESLIEYLRSLEDSIIEKGVKRNWWQSLRSFLTFVRISLSKEQQGLLEIIFPREMELWEDKLIRKMKKHAYPIDIQSAAKIIQALAKGAFEANSETRIKTILSTLGFALLCITASRQRLPTELSMIYQSNTNCLIKKNEGAKNSLYAFKIPTFFDGIDIPISDDLYQFFTIISQMLPSSKSTLFPVTLRSLQRTFNAIIQNMAQGQNLSLLTLLNHPHEVIGHRYKNKPVM